MITTVMRRSLIIVSLLSLAGCAQEGNTRPAFVGLSDLQDGTGAPPTTSNPGQKKESSAVLRHVQSNKVLSAMAFQKVTGQTVDPDSLSGRE